MTPAPNRRRHLRVNVALHGRWDTSTTHQHVTVTDLSHGGCFVETSLGPQPGERVRLVIYLSSVASLNVEAEVAHRSDRGVGFRFLHMDRDQRAILEDAWSHLARNPRPDP